CHPQADQGVEAEHDGGDKATAFFLGHCSISCNCLLIVFQFPVMAVTNPLIKALNPPLAKPPIRQLMAHIPMIPAMVIITPTENLEVSWATSVLVLVFLITCVVMACSLALLKRNRAIVCPLYSSNHARMKKQPKTHLKTSQHIDIHIHAQEKNPAVQTSPRHTSAVRSQSDNRPATVLIRSVACDHTLVW